MPGRLGVVLRWFLPESRPPVPEEQRITGPQVVLRKALTREGAPHICERHLVAGAEVRQALVPGDVDQDAARHDRFHVLDPELLQPVRAVHLGADEAVIVDILLGAVGHLHPHADVTRAVELRADLSDLRAQELVVADEAV
jgi:hypothetical protein